MIYLQSFVAGILALFVSLYGLFFLVVALCMRSIGNPNSYFVVLQLRSSLVWVVAFVNFSAALLSELGRASSKRKRQQIR